MLPVTENFQLYHYCLVPGKWIINYTVNHVIYKIHFHAVGNLELIGLPVLMNIGCTSVSGGRLLNTAIVVISVISWLLGPSFG